MIEFSRLFIDTTPLIYYVEKNPEYYDILKHFFMESYNAEKEFVSSVVTVHEYSVHPYMYDEVNLLKDYNRFIEDTDAIIYDIDSSIADKAARIRAEYKFFKGMDALQLATACLSGCDLFLTNDKQLRQFKEIEVITVAELEDKGEI